MIIVTGANGQLGRAIVESLLDRVPAASIGVSVRDPDKARGLERRGVRVRRGEFDDPGSLDDAFAGATQVLLVSSNARSYGGDTLHQHGVAIAAARAAGARRIVYTSHMGASDTSAFAPMHDHHATEAMLSACAVPWTALRNGFYAASGLALMGDALTSGRVAAPADGKVSWAAHSDLAEAASIMLAEGCHDGPTAPLTGPHGLDLDDLAALASDLTGRRVTRTVIDDPQFHQSMSACGVPDRSVEIALGLYRASREAEFAAVDPTLERMLGRPPLSMRTLIGDSLGR